MIICMGWQYRRHDHWDTNAAGWRLFEPSYNNQQCGMTYCDPGVFNKLCLMVTEDGELWYKDQFNALNDLLIKMFAND